MISETEKDDVVLSELVVVAEELELLEVSSFLAQEIMKRLKQEQYNRIFLSAFIMLSTM